MSLVSCTGQDEGGDSDAVFQVQEGGTLKNVIIGPNQIEGIHCMGACTIENVWWESVCEGTFAVPAPSLPANTSRCTHHQASVRHLARHRRRCKGRRRQSPTTQRRRNTGCVRLLRQRLWQALPLVRELQDATPANVVFRWHFGPVWQGWCRHQFELWRHGHFQ